MRVNPSRLPPPGSIGWLFVSSWMSELERSALPSERLLRGRLLASTSRCFETYDGDDLRSTTRAAATTADKPQSPTVSPEPSLRRLTPPAAHLLAATFCCYWRFLFGNSADRRAVLARRCTFSRSLCIRCLASVSTLARTGGLV